jgi:uncharacterized protein YndB with AHSA1/START domain/DNA-binding transcriptional ArsR family regulator
MANYQASAARFHALADPTRAAIVAQLTSGPASVGDLATPTGLRLPTVLKHLSVLEGAGLVATEKSGRQRLCRLNARALGDARDWLAAQTAAWEARLDRMDRLALTLDRMETLMDPLGPLDLEITRTLKARRAAVWRCWTEPALMEQWFCPRPWRGTDIVVDLRPGGRFKTVIRGPEGEVFDNDPGAFLEVVPMERLVWTSALGPGFRPNVIPEGGFGFTAILSFADAPDGGTLYHARVLHPDAKSKDKHEAMGFHGGWGTAAEQCDEVALTL